MKPKLHRLDAQPRGAFAVLRLNRQQAQRAVQRWKRAAHSTQKVLHPDGYYYLRRLNISGGAGVYTVLCKPGGWRHGKLVRERVECFG